MGKPWENGGIPSGYLKIAMENDPFIVDLPLKMVIFP